MPLGKVENGEVTLSRREEPNSVEQNQQGFRSPLW